MTLVELRCTRCDAPIEAATATRWEGGRAKSFHDDLVKAGAHARIV